MGTYNIVSIRRTRTKPKYEGGPTKPMWRLYSDDGKQFFAFTDIMPDRDSASMFVGSGYNIEGMGEEEIVDWKEWPIRVQVKPRGEFFDIMWVEPRPEGSHPDKSSKPDISLYRDAAINLCRHLMDDTWAFVLAFDLETTGTNETLDDEPISIGVAAVNHPLWLRGGYEEVWEYYSLIRPENPDRISTTKSDEVHGITPDAARNISNPTIRQLYDHLNDMFEGWIAAGYNSVKFDGPCLDQACIRAGLPPIRPLAAVDIMQTYAEFRGEWNYQYRRFEPAKLTVACEEMGIKLDDAHNSLSDSKATAALIKVIAESER